MSRENVIDKVRKLRALSTSSNLNEAANAARTAERLIQEHCLAEAELEVIEGSHEVAGEDGVPLTDWNQRRTVWQDSLLYHLSRAYSCVGILKHEHGKFGYYATGRPSDIATMRYQFAFFVSELTRLSVLMAPNDLSRGEGKTWYKSFYMGAVKAIGESLATAKKETRAQATSNALSIIDKHMDESKSAFMQKYPKTHKMSTAPTNIDLDAWQKGHQAGSGLSPKPGLNPGVRGLLK